MLKSFISLSILSAFFFSCQNNDSKIEELEKKMQLQNDAMAEEPEADLKKTPVENDSEITKAVKEYCFQIGYDADKFDFYVTRAWVNNFDNSDATINRHTHTPSDISISYYPSDSLSPICFENTAKPNEVLQNSFSHDELFLNRNMFSYNYVYVSPEKNTLLVFPSKTYHWVDRVAKEVEHRVSFSADFIMVLKENMRSYEHVRNPINSWRKF